MPSTDPIKRKLDLLEEYFREKESLIQSFAERSPLTFAASGMIFGIALANNLSFSIFIPAILLVVNTAFCILLLKNIREKNRIGILSFLVFSSFLFLGAIRLITFIYPPLSDISNYVHQDRQPAVLRGTVATDIRRENRDNWKFGSFLPLNTSSSFYLNIENIKAKTGWADISGKIHVSVSGRLKNISAGDSVEVYCTLSKFSDASNPGQFDIASYMKHRSVLYGGSVYSTDGVKLLEKCDDVLTSLKFKLKTIFNNSLFSDTQMGNPDAGLLSALLLGTRSRIDTGTYQAFRQTGLSHFISLSGLHMAILATILWRACRFTGLAKPVRAGICFIMILIYISAVPSRAPTLRAAVICCFFFFSMIVKRKPNPLNTLSLSAIILLIISPANLFDIGWQLSFSCVAGIILFYKHTENFLICNTIDRLGVYKRKHISPGAILLRKYWIKLICLLSTGFAAWIGGAGIMAYHFSTITPLAFIWTVLVFPVISVILAIGYLKIILAALLPTVSMLLALILQFLSKLLIGLVRFIAEYEFSQIVTGKVPLIAIALFYMYLLLVRFWHTDKYVLRSRTLWTITLVMAVLIFAVKLPPRQRNKLELTCLDVGHGQAIAVFLPDGRNMLFDAGSLTAKNCGAGIVVPFLQSKGISKLHSIIASHGDIDHINGIPEVASHYKSSSVFANKALIDQIETSSKIRHLSNCLIETSLELKPINNNNDIYCKSIWPPEEISGNPAISINNKSEVIIIEYRGRRVLLCSDIEIFAQSEILKRYPDLKADIIVMPHHGSNINLLEKFANKLQVQKAIISCCRKKLPNTWKPDEDIEAYYTPLHGAITVKIEKDGSISVSTCKK